MKMTAARQAALQAYRKATAGTGLRVDVSGFSTMKVKSLTRKAEKFRQARHEYSRARKNFLRSKVGEGRWLPTVKELQAVKQVGTKQFRQAAKATRQASKAKTVKSREKSIARVQAFSTPGVELPKVSRETFPKPEAPDEWLPQNEPGFDEEQARRDVENRARVIRTPGWYTEGRVKYNNLLDMIYSISPGASWKEKSQYDNAQELLDLLESVDETDLYYNLNNAPSNLIETATVYINYSKGSGQHSQAAAALHTIITGEIPSAEQAAGYTEGAEQAAGYESEETE